MGDLKIKLWFPALALLVISGIAPGVPAEGTFTLEQVLSAPYPSDLVSARSADRIAWVFNSEGARNIWTAAGPDFAPVNLTGYGKDEVFEIPSVAITADGSVVVYVRGGEPDYRGWVTNPTSDPDGVEQVQVRAPGADGEQVGPQRLQRLADASVEVLEDVVGDAHGRSSAAGDGAPPLTRPGSRPSPRWCRSPRPASRAGCCRAG